MSVIDTLSRMLNTAKEAKLLEGTGGDGDGHWVFFCGFVLVGGP